VAAVFEGICSKPSNHAILHYVACYENYVSLENVLTLGQEDFVGYGYPTDDIDFFVSSSWDNIYLLMHWLLAVRLILTWQMKEGLLIFCCDGAFIMVINQ
jgi:hypothetical protein